MRTRQHFEQELDEIHEHLYRIGTMIEHALSNAMKAVHDHDADLAQSVIQGDQAINQAVREVHDRVLLLIATQHPAAGDLRFVSVVLTLLPELERMGDHAASICKLQRRMMAEPSYQPLQALPGQFSTMIVETGQRALSILQAGVEALRSRDRSFAERVVSMDDEIDHLYAQIFRETISASRSHPDLTDEFVHLLTLAHNLERIGDRVTNVAEQIVYLTTGDTISLNH